MLRRGFGCPDSLHASSGYGIPNLPIDRVVITLFRRTSELQNGFSRKTNFGTVVSKINLFYMAAAAVQEDEL